MQDGEGRGNPTDSTAGPTADGRGHPGRGSSAGRDWTVSSPLSWSALGQGNRSALAARNHPLQAAQKASDRCGRVPPSAVLRLYRPELARRELPVAAQSQPACQSFLSTYDDFFCGRPADLFPLLLYKQRQTVGPGCPEATVVSRGGRTHQRPGCARGLLSSEAQGGPDHRTRLYELSAVSWHMFAAVVLARLSNGKRSLSCP